MDTKKNALQPLNIHNEEGSFRIMTADVPLKGMYLTLALCNGLPFDIALSDNVDDAQANHQSFLSGAKMMTELLGPVLGDAAPVDRAMLN